MNRIITTKITNLADPHFEPTDHDLDLIMSDVIFVANEKSKKAYDDLFNNLTLEISKSTKNRNKL